MDKKKIFLVSLGHLSCDINGGALPAILPFLITAYGFDYQAAAGLMFAFSCLSSIIQPAFGYLSDKLSKPWFIPVGVLLAGGGLASIGFLHSYWAIFAAIARSGVGAALFHPEGARFANKVSGASKGTGLSLFSIGGNSGFVFGPMLAVAAIGAFGMPGTLGHEEDRNRRRESCRGNRRGEKQLEGILQADAGNHFPVRPVCGLQYLHSALLDP